MNHPTLVHIGTVTKPNRHLRLLKTMEAEPGQFNAALAHEIRNPLFNIRMAAEMLKSVTGDNSRNNYLDIIVRATDLINHIVTDLLTSSMHDKVQEEKYSIQELLDEALAMAEDRILLKNITIRKAYDPADCKIVLDRPQMKIALTNIIINAIDAMTAGKGQLTLVAKAVNDKYVIEIEDNGTGISKKDLKSIFNPYFTRKPGGMGLGLSTTLNILIYNHTHINVESEEGRGTRFILLFKP